MNRKMRIVVGLLACAVVVPQVAKASTVDRLEHQLRQVEQQCVEVEQQLFEVATAIEDAERLIKYLRRELREAMDKPTRQSIRSQLRETSNTCCELEDEQAAQNAQMEKLLTQVRELKAQIKRSGRR